MSAAAVIDILNRSLLDERFRESVQASPERAFEGYELSDDERSALVSRDIARVADLVGPEACALYCTIRFAIFENIVAIGRDLEASRKVELQARAGEIAQLKGDRTDAIKEFLQLMR